MIATLSTGASLFVFAAIAVGDVRSRTISNRCLALAYALAALWFAIHPAAFDASVVWLGALFLAVGVAAWFAGAIGGGDAKALPLVGLFAGFAFLPQMLAALSLASIGLLLAAAMGRAATAAPGSGALLAERPRAPFGVAIAAAGATALMCRAAIG